MSIKSHPLCIAARPKTLPASISPVILGLSLAWKKTPSLSLSYIFISLLVLLTAILIQILTNYVNDLWDFKKGSDTKKRTGPERVVLSGKMTEQEMMKAILGLTAIIILLGSILTYHGGIVILIIGLLSIVGAYAYTAGPYPLAHNGLGEVFVFIFFGPVAVCGTEYLLRGNYSLEGLLIGTACGLLSSVILVINNTRDISEDRQTGKNTLPAKYGRSFAEKEVLISLTLSYLFTLIALSRISNYYVLILLMIPLSIILYKRLENCEKGEDFNKLLAFSGKHLFIFSLMSSVLILL